MIKLADIGAILYVISGVICAISLFGGLYHKISARTSKILSDIAFVIVFISGVFSWTYLIVNL